MPSTTTHWSSDIDTSSSAPSDTYEAPSFYHSRSYNRTDHPNGTSFRKISRHNVL
ncbi:hypothetical protein EW026_g460 [Hermanssonia centrifuga]|uniref:Uncharacterized protein n=1 Tax=Hermanssonia centrifuga TaxID=98765 RepID=A0A4S4KUM9_9APHY|nr:hypothetical protein EW026_g460 [Hermanssonia centrifuga]